MAPPPTDDDRDESEDERLDRNWDELLQELRITQTGLQLFSGFLLTLPFTQVFATPPSNVTTRCVQRSCGAAPGMVAEMLPPSF